MRVYDVTMGLTYMCPTEEEAERFAEQLRKRGHEAFTEADLPF